MKAGSEPHDSDPRLKSVEQIAAEWVYRRQHALSAAEEADFWHWLKADARHAEVFAEMDATSSMLDRLREPVCHPAWATSGRKVATGPEWARPAAAVRRMAWAAAALIAAGFFLWWHLAPAVPSLERSLTTGRGDLRRLDLPDGSAVQLNTDSSVEVHYTAADRRVRLARGEAFFTVAKNPARPFWVEAGGLSVRAVGTAFDVRYQPGSIEVLVSEGRVRIADRAGLSVLPEAPGGAGARPGLSDQPGASPPEPLLLAGQKAKITIKSDSIRPEGMAVVTAVAPDGIETALRWRERELEFSATPLSDVVAEFNLYNRHKLVIADPWLARQRFGGAFAPHDYGSFVEALEQGFGVVAETRENEIIIRRGH